MITVSGSLENDPDQSIPATNSFSELNNIDDARNEISMDGSTGPNNDSGISGSEGAASPSARKDVEEEAYNASGLSITYVRTYIVRQLSL